MKTFQDLIREMSDAIEPWRMIRADYVKTNLTGIGAQRRGNVVILKAMHRRYVAIAVEEGKPVPPDVLKDYPEISERIL